MAAPVEAEDEDAVRRAAGCSAQRPYDGPGDVRSLPAARAGEGVGTGAPYVLFLLLVLVLTGLCDAVLAALLLRA
ncbi:hypothetical protein AB0M64_26820, partial [Streptomyces sp. NPDC051771]